MATELAKAYVQIIPTTQGMQGELEKQLGGGADVAGKKAGASWATGFKVALGGLAAATGAATKLVSDAVGNYANYEQLIGGVETLFKDSAEIVEGYADRAYMTAGLSANQYMETVTGFSASLLQGLGGDTEKAASVADRAIIDMADNANKMGSSIQSIQNAYQGFAKQNYTMLDNLKLGYGGTKTEMERLISDASKMTDVMDELGVSVEEGSLSFDNIINAISVMQKSLGIAGTTQAEAAGTVTGSLSAMKAAWQNLLTGIADGNADIDGLMSYLIESALTFGSNIIPIIEQAAQGLASLVTGIAPVIAEKLPELVSSILPDLLETGANVLLTIAEGIISYLPQLVPVAVDIIMQLVDGLIDALPMLIDSVVEIILAIVDTLTNPDSVGRLIQAALKIIVSLAEGLIDALPKLMDKIPFIIKNLVEAIVANLPQIIAAGIRLLIALVDGIIQSVPRLVMATPTIIGALVSGIAKGIVDIISVGRDLVDGLWQGIKNAWSNLVDKAKNLASDLVSTFKSVLKIGSPSKVFEKEVGKWIPEGIAVGIEANADSVEGSIEDMNLRAIEASKMSLGSYNMVGQDGNVVGSSGETNSILSLLSEYLPGLANQQIVLDSGALVGATAGKMDAELGRIATFNQRGVLYT